MIIEKISDLQKCNLEMMIAFDKFAKINQIEYFIAYGTLLGAVRHHGFIPWDDDIDLMMTYPNFIKLCSCKNFETNEIYLELPGDNDQFFDFTPHICFPKHTIKRKADGMEVPVYMDIFILSSVHSGLRHKIRDVSLLILYAQARGHRNFQKEIDIDSKKIKSITSIIVGFLEVIGRKRDLKKIIKKYFIVGNKCKNGLKYYICNSIPSKLKDEFNKSWFLSTQYIDICDYSFPAPNGFEEILKDIYGDYMQLPPESERKPEHFMITIDNE